MRKKIVKSIDGKYIGYIKPAYIKSLLNLILHESLKECNNICEGVKHNVTIIK